MTAKEMIRALQTLDPEAIVVIDDWNEGYAAPLEDIGMWCRLDGRVTISAKSAGLDGFEVKC